MPRRKKPSGPNPEAVRREQYPLTRHPRRPEDPLSACNLCGRPGPLEKHPWREHDEHDLPIAGEDALVFLGERGRHVLCWHELEDHPRLYAPVRGEPGQFLLLCGPCENRRGLGCSHPDLKANGGAGLNVSLAGGLPPNTIVCPPPKVVLYAVSCAGRAVKSE